MDTEKKEKIGFVFEGGGIRGNFINGVIDALLDENIKADYIAGSSAGIGNGVNYATAQRGRGLEIVENYIKDKRYMGKKYLFQKSVMILSARSVRHQNRSLEKKKILSKVM